MKPAGSAVHGLHEIYRQIHAATDARRSVSGRARREAKRVRAIYRALRATAGTRGEVASHFGVSRLRQIVDATRFSLIERIDLDSYYKCSLFLADRWNRRDAYLHHQEICVLLERLNAAVSGQDAEDLSDKRRFAARIEKADLPGIAIAGSFERGMTLLDLDETNVRGGDLFSKPANRFCGEGVFRWRARGEGYAAPDGAHMTLEQLVESLRLASRSGPIVLQPCVTNDAALLPLSGQGLSTCRIVTIRGPGSAPRAAVAAYRMPRGSLAADNFARGGLAAPVDLASGTLGAARQKALPDLALEVHPDSGSRIEGTRLPGWNDALDLALRAHREFGDMPSVGWDIALTGRGPVLVEGNAVWCVDLLQITHQRPFADLAIAEDLLAHFVSADIRA